MTCSCPWEFITQIWEPFKAIIPKDTGIRVMRKPEAIYCILFICSLDAMP